MLRTFVTFVSWSLAGGATCLGEAKLFLLPAPDIPSDARIAEVGDRESTQSPTLDSSWSSRKTCIKEEFRPLEMRLD